MYNSEQPEHPGDVIRQDLLPGLNMSCSALARHLGVSRQTLSRIINKRQGINLDVAIRLGHALNADARYWLALQMHYDVWLAERENDFKVKPITPLQERPAAGG